MDPQPGFFFWTKSGQIQKLGEKLYYLDIFDFWKSKKVILDIFEVPFRFEEFSHILDYSRVLHSSDIFTRYPFPVCRSFLWARHLKISDFIKFTKLTMFWKKFYLDFTLLYNWKTLFLSIQFSILYFFVNGRADFLLCLLWINFKKKLY